MTRPDEPGLLNPAQLVDHAGRLLYGERYAGQLAAELGVDRRGIERRAAAAGDGRDYPMARAILHDVLQLLDTRAGDVADLAREGRRTAAAFDVTPR